MAEFKSPAVLLYVQGISEPLRRSLEQQGIRTVFKSDKVLWSHWNKTKRFVWAPDQKVMFVGDVSQCHEVLFFVVYKFVYFVSFSVNVLS